MTLQVWLTYLATVVILMSTPGPSHLLMLANSLSSGFPKSSATAAGDLSANFLQMFAAALGLAVLIQQSAFLFQVIKWLGVAYLVYLAVRLLAVGNSGTSAKQRIKSRKELFWQGFITSAANPKAIVFFTALFPQFIDPALDVAPQFLILSTTYLLVDALFLLFYGLTAGWVGKHLATRQRLIERLSGLCLLITAVLLGAKTLETNQMQ